ncbi:MAG: VOC family protein [Acidobacteria bacterium Pan2503]|uniref:VOC family protein n=1 Tax=Candidatus Acidiferrum panamense TaxID=2741543 RepID=A0A7V8NVQ9_9BACT|nr:VOC family protein [Candidatus Acidoferrum panamensis]
MHGIEGLHHATAIASEPQTNINLYTGVLGVRLVKQTIDFDDPTTHLYQLYPAMQQIEDRRALDQRRRDGACCCSRLDKNSNHARRNFARFLLSYSIS